MDRHSRTRSLLALAVVAALGGWAARAEASGFQLIEQNGSGLGLAHAGEAAAAEDASTVFFNPAGMTRLEGKHLVLAGNMIGIDTTFTDSASAPPFKGTLPVTVPLGGDGGQAGAWTPVPSAYLSWQLSSRVWAGLGLNVPFGLKTEWDDDWMGRFHGVESEVKTYNVNPSVAFKVNDKISLGAGVSWQRLEATLSSSVPYGAASYLGALTSAGGATAASLVLAQLGGPAGLAREGLSVVEGNGSTIGWNVGVLVQPTEKVRFGLSYRAAMEHDLEGEVKFSSAPSFSLPGPLAPLAAGLNARFADGPVKTTIEMPATFSAAAAVKATDKLELLADWTWTGWDAIAALAIDREDGSELTTTAMEFVNTWRMGLGGNYDVNDRVRIRVGMAFDKAPAQDEHRTPRLPDEDRIWAAAGVRFKVGDKGAVDLGLVHLIVDETPSQLVPHDTASAARGALVGSYTTAVNIVALQYRHSF